MKLRAVLVFVLLLVLAGPGLQAAGAPALDSRDGDNSLYFEWDLKERRVTTATSSLRISDKSRVRIMTSLRDRPNRIAMRATLKNVSDEVIVLDGRLVHKIWAEGETLIRRLKSRLLTKRLEPGEYVSARFSYLLPSGWYSARTDFVAR
ncbi:MAG: hypothetical protein M3277_10035 [Actinomycetota bacterium]|nr:hypothetical protein [Actinomycetota bacterium]